MRPLRGSCRAAGTVVARLLQTDRRPIAISVVAPALGAVAVLLLVVATVTGTGACPEPVSRIVGEQASATLDAEHPVVVQRIAVSIPAAVLPLDPAPASVRLAILLTYPGQGLPTDEFGGPRSGPANPSPDVPPSDPLLSVVTVRLRDDATGRIVPNIGAPESRIGANHANDQPSIALDCDLGRPCERDYAVILALTDPSASAVTIVWQPVVLVEFPRDQLCLPPQGGGITAVATAPLPAAARSDATTGVRHESGASTVARHVTISTPGGEPGPAADDPFKGGGGAILRVSLHGADIPDRRWHAWVRVVPDTGATPIVEGLVHDDSLYPHDGFLDASVLTECPSAAPCARGYWIVIESVPSSSGPGSAALETNVGHLTWRVDVMSIASSGVLPGSLTATVDTDRTLDPEVFERQAAGEGTFSASKTDRDLIVPFFVTLPDAADRIPRDRRVAASMIVSLKADTRSVSSVTYSFPGDSGSRTSSLAGITPSLIAYPLDRCATGTCQIDLHVRLSPIGSPLPAGADVTWSVTLVGFPPGTSVRAGDAVDGPGPPAKVDVGQAGAILTLVVVIGGFVLLVGRRARRRVSASPR